MAFPSARDTLDAELVDHRLKNLSAAGVAIERERLTVWAIA